MDLKMLHPVEGLDRDYRVKDKLNGLTGRWQCWFLEWSGWYNQDLRQRLLGHYRLFKRFQQRESPNLFVPFPLAYIIAYRASHGLKYTVSRIIGAAYRLVTGGGFYYPGQTEMLNRLLLMEYPWILEEFLAGAEINASDAIAKAVSRINSLNFRSKFTTNYFSFKQCISLQSKTETNIYNSSNHYFNEFTTVQSLSNGITGKQKGVFSKKQLLIFFDLLASAKGIERIDFGKPNKYEAVAELMFAISSKSKQSWLEEMKNYRSKNLYECSGTGDLKQLVATITNLSETMRRAGFREISLLADKKLRELERQHLS